MEEDPDVVSGRDEGWRDGRATEPEGLLAGRGCRAQQEPVQGALMRLLHIEVTETAGAERTMERGEWTAQAGRSSWQGWSAPSSPSTPSHNA